MIAPHDVNIAQLNVSLGTRNILETTRPPIGFNDFGKWTEFSMRRAVVPIGFGRIHL
jgi:hypothetical protein